MSLSRPLLLAVLTTLLACGSSTEPSSTAELDGTWGGNGNRGSSISMTITCPGFQPFSYTGSEKNSAPIEGHFQGSGIPRTAVTLRKV